MGPTTHHEVMEGQHGTADDAPQGDGAAARHRHKKHSAYFEERAGVTVWVTEHVEEYRAVAERELHPSDCVLELGCAGGVTTAAAGRHAAVSCGVDKNDSERVLQKQASLCTTQVPGLVTFRELDALDVKALLKLQTEFKAAYQGVFNGFTVVFVDLSGSREIGTLLRLVERLEHPSIFGNTLRLVVIKSYRLACLVPRCRMFDQPPSLQARGKPEQSEAISAGSSSRLAFCKLAVAMLPLVLCIGFLRSRTKH